MISRNSLLVFGIVAPALGTATSAQQVSAPSATNRIFIRHKELIFRRGVGMPPVITYALSCQFAV